MSIQGEIDRIAGAKTTLGNYLQQNGVAVPSGATLDEMALQLADVIEKQNKITARGILKGNGAGSISAAAAGTDYQAPAAQATALPTSGTALKANTIYLPTTAVNTYAFKPPTSSGWAHGKFTTGSSVSVSFSGTFVGAAPTIEASKAYEFDVYNGVWAVQEVVSA